MEKMLAAVLTGVKKLELCKVDIPRPGPGEVVVQVRACGICQTDYKAYMGERMNWKPPMIIGHEMSGIVSAQGSGGPFREGDEVVVAPVASCGLCQQCRNGMQHYCPNRAVIGGDGADMVWDGGSPSMSRCLCRRSTPSPPG